MATLNLGSVGITEYAITEMAEDGITAVVPGLPTDGSLALAFLTLPSTIGTWSGTSPPDRFLIAFTGGRLGGKSVTFAAPGVPPGPLLPPAGWNFI